MNHKNVTYLHNMCDYYFYLNLKIAQVLYTTKFVNFQLLN